MRRSVRTNRLKWVQVNCALFPRSPDGELYFPWTQLAEAIETWRTNERFERFFFMRKSPGLRLRFWGIDLEERLEPVLVAWLELAELQNLIRGFRFVLYEPEEFRFGGPSGMSIAHDHFDRDSRIAMRYQILLEFESKALPRDLLSVAITNDLFTRCVGDRAEVWDIWQRLQRALGDETGKQLLTASDLQRERDAVLGSAAFMQNLSPEETQLICDAQVDNQHIAARLHSAEIAGRISVSVRKWLVSASIFHWNRLGLTSEELNPMVIRLSQIWDPVEP